MSEQEDHEWHRKLCDVIEHNRAWAATKPRESGARYFVVGVCRLVELLVEELGSGCPTPANLEAVKEAIDILRETFHLIRIEGKSGDSPEIQELLRRMEELVAEDEEDEL